MKIIITGSLGHISKPLAEILVRGGHQVTVISSDSKKINTIEALGARAAIGSVSDTGFLKKTFENADAVYTMVPPEWTTPDYMQFIRQTGENYFNALKASGVKRVVNLSSIGADLDKGTGPIAGLHEVEEKLNALENADVIHLRPGYFYTNFFFDIPMIRNMGVLGSNYSSTTRILMAHPKDIAAVAAEELQGSSKGKTHRYIICDDREAADVARVLGTSIGNPALPWVQFSDADAFEGMKGAGLSESIARLYVEMGRSFNSGIAFEDFNRQGKKDWGSTKLTEFANEFAAAYNSANKPQAV